MRNNFFNLGKFIIDIKSDFKAVLSGIKGLPKNAKLPVLIAYTYYLNLLKKIRRNPAEKFIKTRIRVHDFRKLHLLSKANSTVKMMIF